MLESTSEIRPINEHENEDPWYKLGRSEEIAQLLNLLHYAQNANNASCRTRGHRLTTRHGCIGEINSR